MFKKAKPVWLQGRQQEMNVQAGFNASIKYQGGECVLRITGASFYKIHINGRFVHYGPARAAHGYSRVDTIELGEYLSLGQNIMAIEVAGYYCPCYDGVKMMSFLQAEIEQYGQISAFTSPDGDFKGAALNKRIQKVGRYSVQRHFLEAYRLDNAGILPGWFIDEELQECEALEEINQRLVYLEREVPMPAYDATYPAGRIEKSRAQKRITSAPAVERHFLKRVMMMNDGVRGFSDESLEEHPLEVLDKYEFLASENSMTDVPGFPYNTVLSSEEFSLFSMGRIKVGFINLEMAVFEDSVVDIIFDEKILSGQLSTQNSCVNIIRYRLKRSGRPYSLSSFEPYGLMYCAIFVESGKVRLDRFSMTEFAYPCSNRYSFHSSDRWLDLLVEAATESFRHNTVDIFMDCPTRERAGWLCDSYFTAQAEALWGSCSCVERTFMDNYRLYPGMDNLPAGMLPMCYPADHISGIYIPQWALWYVIQLDAYLKRDPEAKPESYQKLCYGLLAFFDLYTNDDGLLEKLPSWNFIEWSDANNWTQDVNYPTNMLYARVLEIVGSIYDNEMLIARADKVRNTIISQAYDGKYFVDNSVRDKSGRLCITQNRSEVCQYYAFYFRTIDPEDINFSGLKETILNVFGPDRKRKGILPYVSCANAFIGNYLRMELLLQWGEHQKMLEEIKAYFIGMAQATGTLWEMMEPVASLDHGFASMIGVLVTRALAGIADIDERRRTITINYRSLPVEADIVLPLRNGSIHVVRHAYDAKPTVEIEASVEYGFRYM